MIGSERIQLDVLEELAYDPAVDSSRIAVTVADGGVVTISGIVASYAERRAAERAAQRVRGVAAVANDLVVTPRGTGGRDDRSIAVAAAQALEHSATVPRGAVRAIVSQGWVTLEGSVPWDYQRQGAVQAVHDIAGIRGISNHIQIHTAAKVGDIHDLIDAAFRRQALFEPHQIGVEVVANGVTLRGTVSSWAQREAAEHAAFSAPGVARVDNRIVIAASALV